MISDLLADKVSVRLSYSLEKTKLIFQDFDDKYIERALKVRNPQCMRELTEFIEGYTQDLNVLAHLRGFNSMVHMEECYCEIEGIQSEIRSEFNEEES